MCGIAVIIGGHSAGARVHRMKQLLVHRGDTSDPIKEIGECTAFGAERLRIVDFAGGQQPMKSADGQWNVVFNGEIYNHHSLRALLEGEGISFHSKCDTEVLANMVATRGRDCLPLLDGMFAFVAIHKDGVRFLAARDPMGVKPLYMLHEEDAVLFASEIRPLLEVSRKAPVEIVAPGTWITQDAKGVHFDRHHNNSAYSRSLEQHAAELNRLLIEAVRKRLPPDLPCAVLFSGGIDSTLILHIARKINRSVKGFYIGNPDGADYRYAKLYCESTGADVEFLPSALPDVLNCIPQTVAAVETFEPNQVRGGCLTYLLSKAISEAGYRVALCGEGADELFCGYPELQITDTALSQEAVDSQIRASRDHWLDYLHRTQLQRVDRCAMRHQLEVRVPFLDAKIVALSERLPLAHMVVPNSIERNQNKIVLRKVYDLHPDIPAEFSSRSKIVFTEGSGLGTNDPLKSPFYTFTLARAANRPLHSTSGEIQFRTQEERYYWELLERSVATSRMPFLHDRPRLNTK